MTICPVIASNSATFILSSANSRAKCALQARSCSSSFLSVATMSSLSAGAANSSQAGETEPQATGRLCPSILISHMEWGCDD